MKFVSQFADADSVGRHVLRATRSTVCRLALRLPVLMLLVFAWAAGQGRGVLADDGPSLSIQQVGFGGAFKVGHWVPAWIQINAPPDRALTGQLELVAVDADGVATHYRLDEQTAAETVAQGSSRTLIRYFRTGRIRSQLTARWLDAEGDDSLLQTTVALEDVVPAAHEMFVTLGADAGVADALGLRPRSQRGMSTSIVLEPPIVLPDRWYGYESVDFLFVTTSNRWWQSLSPEQASALEQWVRLGGRLILVAGQRGKEVMADDSPLAELVPGQFGGTLNQGSSGLENFAGSVKRLDPLPMTVLEQPAGNVLAYDQTVGRDRLPLIVQAPHALGLVIFLGVDLDEPPLAGWSARPALVSALIRSQQQRDDVDGSQQASRLSHLGFTDLSGQLRSALDQFPATSQRPGVRTVSFTLVTTLIVVYILLIGPGEYFLLRRLLRRMHWTWITFPLLVIAFAAGIWLLGQNYKGDQLHLNQVDLVDWDVTTGQMRGTSWSQIYSPSANRFHLTMVTSDQLRKTMNVPADKPLPLLTAWGGLPGRGLGGMDTSINAATFLPPYTITTSHPDSRPVAGADDGVYSSQLFGMPLAVSATKNLVGRWSYQTTSPAPDVSRLTSREGILQGQLQNVLEVPLHDCVIMYRGWVYHTENVVQPGETIDIGALNRRDLEWRLTRRRLLRSESTYTTTPWDPTSFDVPRILEMMMFHDAAGGSTYTELTHRYYAFTDLSSHLSLGRAVLVGRADAPATNLLADDRPLVESADRNWTYYRVLYPVAAGD